MKKSSLLILALLFVSLQAIAANHLAFKLEGLNVSEQKNALARLEIVRNTFPEDMTDVDINELYKLGANEVKKALQPFGYYKSQVEPKLSQHKDNWIATYKIKKGPTLKITSVNISVIGDGANNNNILQALNSITLKKGDVLVTYNYEEAKDKLFTASNDAGYIKAYFDKTEILIDLQKYTARITIRLQTGKRYYFGKTTFGPSPYSKNFLSRFIAGRDSDGKPFSNQVLLDLQQNMTSSAYFDQVDIIPDYKNVVDSQVPLRINTTVPRSQRYDIGVGYGTFTGPRMSAGVSFRRLNDAGHRLDFNMRLSQVLTAISAKYFIPGKNPLTDSWMLGTDYKKFSPKNGFSESQSAFGGQIRKIGNLQRSITLNYLLERYYVLNQPNRNRNFLYPNLTLGYVDANDLANPEQGYSLNLDLKGGSDKVFSATNFLQLDAKAKAITTPVSFAKIIARVEFGYTVVNDLQNLPLTLRFFTGGLTVRGYPDSSIGPGKYLQVASLEYQNKIYGDFWGAAFYDVGSASDHLGQPMNKGIGVGAIYHSAIGPIKIYLGRAISKKTSPYDVELSVGPEF